MTEVPFGTQRKSFDSSGLQHAWDATSISLASECLRKYQLRMIQGWSLRAKSVHLIFGGIYAASLEHYFKQIALGTDHENSVLDTVAFALTRSYNYDPALGPVGPIQFDDDNKTRFTLIRTIVWYLDEFGAASGNLMKTYHLADGTPAVELTFALELNDEILLTGHLDRVCTFGDDLYILDQKTTKSTISESYWRQFNPNNQIFQYATAGEIILKSPISGIIIDAAQIAVNFSRFERRPIMIDREQLEEWRENALYIISAARSATALDKFPMNLSSCNNYGGCEFRNICNSPKRIRPALLAANYSQTTVWDPLENR